MKITEINIVPVKPANGLVAFASCVFEDSLYLGSIGIMSRPDGTYRLTYPTKNIGERNFNFFYPISRQVGQEIQEAIINEYEKVMKGNHARYYSSDPNTGYVRHF